MQWMCAHNAHIHSFSILPTLYLSGVSTHGLRVCLACGRVLVQLFDLHMVQCASQVKHTTCKKKLKKTDHGLFSYQPKQVRCEFSLWLSRVLI